MKRLTSTNKLIPLTISAIISALLSVGCAQQTVNETQTSSKKPLNATPLVAQANQQVKAYARFVPFREDDFAWENDKVAFRMYGPSSLATPTQAASGIDCWLKRVDYSIIDKWYHNYQNNISYHTDWGEGYDPYHTGTSRGTGGTALWIDGTPYPAGTFSAWRIINNGPEQVVFELDYHWQTTLGKVSETKKISLALGSQLFNVSSTFLLNDQPAKDLPIAIGITTHDEAAKTSSNKASGWIAAWETINGDDLGTGVKVDPKTVQSIVHRSSSDKDKSHIWLITHTNNKGKLEYSAGYGWAKAKEITTETQWQAYLTNYSIK